MNIKQEAFCQAYFDTRDVKQAALSAGYGPDERSAQNHGYRLLKLPEIQARIDTIRAEWRATADISREKVIQELKAVAFQNIQDEAVTSADGQLYLPLDNADIYIRNVASMPREVTAAIKGIRVTSKGELIVERWDKNAALRMLCDILGIHSEHETTVNISMTALEEARARVAAMDDDGQVVLARS